MTNFLTRFADVITLSSSRSADPASAGIDRFVGLEHIQPENLHIRSWGNVADGKTFTNTFQRVQVLLGKRRANDSNLSMPLYMRERSVNDEKSEYATNGLKMAEKARQESSKMLNQRIEGLIDILPGIIK